MPRSRRRRPEGAGRPASAAGAGPAGGLRVAVIDGRGRPVRDGGLARWLASVAPRTVQGEVAVALVTDAHIRELNRKYRRKNRLTDVLSFPSGAANPVGSEWHYSVRVGPHPLARALGGAVARRFPPAPRSGRRRSPAPRIPRPAPRFLGDIVIATGVARRQAREIGHTYATELRVLALHGFLHLLGYDHERSDDAGRMGRAEARWRRRGGLTSGLIGRARRPRIRRKP